jgi:hypothetical protein
MQTDSTILQLNATSRQFEKVPLLEALIGAIDSEVDEMPVIQLQ